MILRPRDREIIVAVHIFRLLTRGQIARLFGFSCTRRINSRLRKLFDHEYLDRSFLATVRGSGQAIYCLGLKGVDVVTRELGLDPVQVKRQRRSTRALRELFLAHALELNDVRIAFSQAIAGQPEMKLERWISDHECEQTYKIDYRSKEITRRFRPDGYLRFWHKGKLYSFFLEHDRATMSLGRFKKEGRDVYRICPLGLLPETVRSKIFSGPGNCTNHYETGQP